MELCLATGRLNSAVITTSYFGPLLQLQWGTILVHFIGTSYHSYQARL